MTGLLVMAHRELNDLHQMWIIDEIDLPAAFPPGPHQTGQLELGEVLADRRDGFAHFSARVPTSRSPAASSQTICSRAVDASMPKVAAASCSSSGGSGSGVERGACCGANPGHIGAGVPVELARPRDRRAPAFVELVDRLYDLLTGREPDAGGPVGLVEIVYANGGRVDLPDIAAELNFEIDDLLPLVDAAAMLGLLLILGADLTLTPIGAAFTTASIQASKQIFAEQARGRAPLVRTICRALATSADGNLRAGFFLDLLRRAFSTEDARSQLDTAIDWGRYAELFDYDTGSDQISADPNAGIHPGRAA